MRKKIVLMKLYTSYSYLSGDDLGIFKDVDALG